MALAMSAAAIHAQNAPDPGQMLSMLLATLREELATTEMFISLFFGVLERKSSTLRYSNTGHPHAFIFGKTGKPKRLEAHGPPLGMSDEIPGAAAESWKKGEDLLVLFTDGVIDARSPTGERLGEAKVLEVVGKNRAEAPEEILRRVFAMLSEHTGGAPSDDDLTLLLLRS
jgi:serine phosphatase RsbU (regulator of sigma subunit)